MNASAIAKTIADRIAAGGDLLEDGQWVDEYLTVQRRDGETVRRGAHIRIGYMDAFGQARVTPPLPVALADGQTGIPDAACLAADRVAADAAREAVETERDQERARAESAETERDQERARAESAELERDQERARAESAETLAAERAATIAAKQARIDELKAQQTTAPVSGQDPVSGPPKGA